MGVSADDLIKSAMLRFSFSPKKPSAEKAKKKRKKLLKVKLAFSPDKNKRRKTGRKSTSPSEFSLMEQLAVSRCVTPPLPFLLQAPNGLGEDLEIKTEEDIPDIYCDPQQELPCDTLCSFFGSLPKLKKKYFPICRRALKFIQNNDFLLPPLNLQKWTRWPGNKPSEHDDKLLKQQCPAYSRKSFTQDEIKVMDSRLAMLLESIHVGDLQLLLAEIRTLPEPTKVVVKSIIAGFIGEPLLNRRLAIKIWKNLSRIRNDAPISTQFIRGESPFDTLSQAVSTSITKESSPLKDANHYENPTLTLRHKSSRNAQLANEDADVGGSNSSWRSESLSMATESCQENGANYGDHNEVTCLIPISEPSTTAIKPSSMRSHSRYEDSTVGLSHDSESYLAPRGLSPVVMLKKLPNKVLDYSVAGSVRSRVQSPKMVQNKKNPSVIVEKIGEDTCAERKETKKKVKKEPFEMSNCARRSSLIKKKHPRDIPRMSKMLSEFFLDEPFQGEGFMTKVYAYIKQNDFELPPLNCEISWNKWPCCGPNLNEWLKLEEAYPSLQRSVLTDDEEASLENRLRKIVQAVGFCNDVGGIQNFIDGLVTCHKKVDLRMKLMVSGYIAGRRMLETRLVIDVWRRILRYVEKISRTRINKKKFIAATQDTFEIDAPVKSKNVRKELNIKPSELRNVTITNLAHREKKKMSQKVTGKYSYNEDETILTRVFQQLQIGCISDYEPKQHKIQWLDISKELGRNQDYLRRRWLSIYPLVRRYEDTEIVTEHYEDLYSEALDLILSQGNIKCREDVDVPSIMESVKYLSYDKIHDLLRQVENSHPEMDFIAAVNAHRDKFRSRKPRKCSAARRIFDLIDCYRNIRDDKVHQSMKELFRDTEDESS